MDLMAKWIGLRNLTRITLDGDEYLIHLAQVLCSRALRVRSTGSTWAVVQQDPLVFKHFHGAYTLTLPLAWLPEELEAVACEFKR